MGNSVANSKDMYKFIKLKLGRRTLFKGSEIKSTAKSFLNIYFIYFYPSSEITINKVIKVSQTSWKQSLSVSLIFLFFSEIEQKSYL